METVQKKVNSIVIVGGGTAGWMTGAALSHRFKGSAVNVTLIASSEIASVGVGEATIPTIRRFYQNLGLTDQQVMKKTQATCKLGIEFRDWLKKDHTFFHPFGLFGQNVNHIPFHHYWLKLKQQGSNDSLADYSLAVQLARQGKFQLPFALPSNHLEIFDWALHFDATRFAELMQEVSLQQGINYLDKRIHRVELDSGSGEISHLVLDDGHCVQGDLFIDCSGFNGLLIGKALKTGYQNWSRWLVCDRAIAVQSQSTKLPPPKTTITALQAGWQWRIPLQHRQGNGHVYSSKFIDDQAAKNQLLDNVNELLISEPKQFSFVPGRRELAWNKNCIAVGLSAGFIEPLESTSIALVETALDRILQSLSQPVYDQQKVDRFNEVSRIEHERVRDFIILHYKANQRTDSAMWRFCRSLAIPDSLSEKMERFKRSGELQRLPWEIFGADSWLAIYAGFNYFPDTYDEKVDTVNLTTIIKGLAEMRRIVYQHALNAPMHHEFLKQHLGFKRPKTQQPQPCED